MPVASNNNMVITIIDVACPFNTRVKNKEQEKVENYQDLKQEIGSVWNCHNVKIIPIIVGALGTAPRGLIKGLDALEMTSAFNLLQKGCLQGRLYTDKTNNKHNIVISRLNYEAFFKS